MKSHYSGHIGEVDLIFGPGRAHRLASRRIKNLTSAEELSLPAPAEVGVMNRHDQRDPMILLLPARARDCPPRRPSFPCVIQKNKEMRSAATIFRYIENATGRGRSRRLEGRINMDIEHADKLDRAQLDDILVELDQFLTKDIDEDINQVDENDEDANIGLDESRSIDDYERHAVIELPVMAGYEYHAALLSVPIKKILEWLAEWDPSEADVLLGIRDDFFSGDHEDDYSWMIDPPMFFPSMEDRAVLRAARAAHKTARDLERARLEREEHERLSNEEADLNAQRAMWRPFAAERLAVEAEIAGHQARVRKLFAEWDRFIVERESWGEDRSAREEAERTRLGQFKQEIDVAYLAISDRRMDLTDRAQAAASSTKAAGTRRETKP